jgi:TRAP-type mannitol/chloroaromatic compound transport system substrate-binding protein
MAASWSGGPTLEYDARGVASLIEKLSNGSIKVQVFPGGTLGKPGEVSGTVKSGVAQIGHTFMGYDAGKDPTTVLFAGSPGRLTPEEFVMWMLEGSGGELANEFRQEKFGVVSLPCGTFPTEIFLHSRKPVRTVEDFKNLKFRTAGAWAEIAGGLGASTISIPGGETYTALERGVIDALEWSSLSVNEPEGFRKIAKYIMYPGMHSPGGMMECVINKDAWEALTDEQRGAVKLAGRIATIDGLMRYAATDIKAYKDVKASNNEFVELDPEFRKQITDAIVKWEQKEAEKDPSWFGKVLAARTAFKVDLDDFWGKFRFPIGPKSGLAP